MSKYSSSVKLVLFALTNQTLINRTFEEFFNHGRVSILAGAYNRENDLGATQIIPVKSYSIHEKYIGTALKKKYDYEDRFFDIALLRLEHEIRFVRTKEGLGSVAKIELPQQGEVVEVASILTVAGWGLIRPASKKAPILKTSSYRVAEAGVCGNWTRADIELCLATSSCESLDNTDAGFPCVMMAKDKKLKQVAIVSRIDRDHRFNVATNVAAFSDWVKAKVHSKEW